MYFGDRAGIKYLTYQTKLNETQKMKDINAFFCDMKSIIQAKEVKVTWNIMLSPKKVQETINPVKADNEWQSQKGITDAKKRCENEWYKL